MANEVKFKVLIEGIEKMQAEIKKGAESLDDFGKSAEKLSKNMQQVGTALTFFGASISGPLVLAFKNAEKSSYEVSKQMERLSKIANDFQKDIATAILPTMEKFVNILGGLYKAFQSLDNGLKQQILQGALLTGVFLSMAGILTVIGAKVLGLIGNMAQLAATFLTFVAVNPGLAAIGVSIAVLVALMFKFEGVANTVISAAEVMFKTFQIGFDTVAALARGYFSLLLDGWALVVEGLAKIPGPLQEQLQATADLLQNNATLMRRIAYDDLQAVGDKSAEIGEILKTGTGEWSEGFQKVKADAVALFQTLEKGGESVKQLSEFEKKGAEITKKVNSDKLGSLKDTLQQAATLNKGFAIAYKAIAISEAIWNTAAGVTRAFKDFPFPVNIAIGGLIAAAGAVQIATIASQSFAVGTPNLPSDMTANVHKGEMIVPATFSEAIRSGELSLSGGGSSGGATFDFRGASFNGVTEEFVRDVFTKASEGIRARTITPLPG